MLWCALIFLVVADVAGILGCTSLTGPAAWIAKVLFGVFLLLSALALARGEYGRPLR